MSRDVTVGKHETAWRASQDCALYIARIAVAPDAQRNVCSYPWRQRATTNGSCGRHRRGSERRRSHEPESSRRRRSRRRRQDHRARISSSAPAHRTLKSNVSRQFSGSFRSDATLYVTLEPCSTYRATGPCTDAIRSSGIKTVVVGAIDPNPRHAGRGIELLKAAGITVRADVLPDECAAINEGVQQMDPDRTALVIAKCGMSLDGRLTPHQARNVGSPAPRLVDTRTACALTSMQFSSARKQFARTIRG